MRYFFSTGEPSGELSAIALAKEIAKLDPAAEFEGIGAERMREAGFTLWRNNTGWASMGPLAAAPRIPRLLAIMLRTAAHIARSQPDLVILVDFGVFNLRLANRLRRRYGYELPIIDWFPPGAWLDRERTARAVATLTVPLTAFAHQYEFYKQLRLPIVFLGHPLADSYTLRPPRPAPASDAGTVAILPGSRRGELRQHIPVLRDAYLALRRRRPRLRAVIGAANKRCETMLRSAFAGVPNVTIANGVAAAIGDADAAWVSSGTAVLETALSGVPSAVLYVIPRILVRHARRIYSGTFIALPNLILQREALPELLQEAATPAALCEAMERLLWNPERQYADLTGLRAALGPPKALERSAEFAVAVAHAGRQ